MAHRRLLTTLQKKPFDRLVLRMRQMDEVATGRRKPWRRFEVEPQGVEALHAQTGPAKAPLRATLHGDYTVAVETTDRLTDRQVVAKMRSHFGADG
jgi:hypothetical protein